MISLTVITTRYPGVTLQHVTEWVARGWVQAEGAAPDLLFAEQDIARLRLLWDLQVDLAIDVEALPVVLSLLDQVSALRSALTAAVPELGTAPDAVKQRVATALYR